MIAHGRISASLKVNIPKLLTLDENQRWYSNSIMTWKLFVNAIMKIRNTISVKFSVINKHNIDHKGWIIKSGVLLDSKLSVGRM